MVIQERLYTVEEFLEIANLPENADKRLELDEGVIVEIMSPSNKKNTVTASLIGGYLNLFVVPRQLGYVSGPDGGYQLTSTTMRQPDTAFLSKLRHSQLEADLFLISPDLAVETDEPKDRPVIHVFQYINAGTRLVWTVYADEQKVYAWQPADGGLRVQEYGIDDTLYGGDVLPGFSLRVRDIFPA